MGSVTPARSDRTRMCRCYSTEQKRYAAAVVGAGPAGIAAVGRLLEDKGGPVLWVDHLFDGGRLNKCYREVPSNTKVKFFTSYAEGTGAFRSIAAETPEPNAVSHLRGLDQQKTCHIAQAADLCLMLTKGLDEGRGVSKHKGAVTEASWSGSTWTISISPDSASSSNTTPTKVVAAMLVLCTGSSPISAPLPEPVHQIPRIHLDTALSPTKLSQALAPDASPVVAVIGASHSAILVLRNLSYLARSTHPRLRIAWFTRHPLRYAEERDGWILRDNTGLKGEVAAWARDNLEPDRLPRSPVSRHLAKVSTAGGGGGKGQGEEEEEEQECTQARELRLRGCTHVVQAVGYRADALPALAVEGRAVEPRFDHVSGGFEDAGTGRRIRGLYGAGIAFPERVVDPEGHVEYAVGLFKFSNFLKRVVPSWES